MSRFDLLKKMGLLFVGLLLVASWLKFKFGSPEVAGWFGLFFALLVGNVLIAQALLSLRRRRLIDKHGIPTTGRCVGVTMRGGGMTLLTVRFVLPDGQQVITKSRQTVPFYSGLTGWRNPEGRKLAFKYNPAIPSEVYFHNAFSFIWFPGLQVVFGVFVIAFGMLIAVD